MESIGFHKRSRFPAVTAALALSLALPTGTLASSMSGGTEPAGGSGTARHTTSRHTGGSGGRPAKPSPQAKSRRTKPAPRVAVKIVSASCAPAGQCSTIPHQVSTHGTLLLQGQGLKSGQAVAFPRARGARIAGNSPTTHLYVSKLGGLAVRVPASAHSGDIAVMLARGRRSNLYGPISVVRYALHPPLPPAPVVPPLSNAATTASGTGFAGQGMWIWYVSQSDGGSVAAVAAQAHAAGVTTVFIKSSDGSSNYWSQFSPQLVAELHANDLKACAWQYVYGTNPVGEADLGAQAVANGADCLVIDAESEYEGRYGAAQTYIETLRAKIGPAYPLGLASFPYVDYHPSFPYSVFLGPNGAQFNAPQMYWHDIGTSVADVYVHTYEENLIYGRAIVPLGQTYGGVSPSEIVAFRSLAGPYGAPGLSFWDWQETSSAGWAALVAPPNTSLTVPQPELTAPLLREGVKSDQVLWLQEHLASAVPSQPTTGIFESQTVEDLKQFQTAHGIPATGETDTNTWAALLTLPPVAVDWTGGGPRT
jgi:peptidoglycan hydrolase-like protein with peptidoglycan-binding domain